MRETDLAGGHAVTSMIPVVAAALPTTLSLTADFRCDTMLASLRDAILFLRFGTGGIASQGAVELQGDLRDRIRQCLLKKGFVVKG